MDSIALIEATPEDVSTIRKIAYDTWYVAYGDILSRDQIDYMLEKLYSEAVISQLIASHSQTFLLLKEGGIFKAFASYGAIETGCKLHKIYIIPSAQGRGFGSRLVKEIIARTHQAGYRVLELNVNRQNKAKAFYEHMGFEVVREEDIPIGPYWMNDFVMHLKT